MITLTQDEIVEAIAGWVVQRVPQMTRVRVKVVAQDDEVFAEVEEAANEDSTGQGRRTL